MFAVCFDLNSNFGALFDGSRGALAGFLLWLLVTETPSVGYIALFRDFDAKTQSPKKRLKSDQKQTANTKIHYSVQKLRLICCFRVDMFFKMKNMKCGDQLTRPFGLRGTVLTNQHNINRSYVRKW